MYAVKNVTPGIRGIRPTGHAESYVNLDPGQTLTNVALTPAELESARSTGYFEITEGKVAGAPAAPVSGDGLDSATVKALKKLAEDEAIDLGDAKTKTDITAAIRAARAKKAGDAGQTLTGDEDPRTDDELRAAVIEEFGEDGVSDLDRQGLLDMLAGE